MVKKKDWSLVEDSTCLFVAFDYERTAESAPHGQKIAVKDAYCKALIDKSSIFECRSVIGLRQHMDYLIRILKETIEDEKIIDQYKHLKGLWSKATIDPQTINTILKANLK